MPASELQGSRCMPCSKSMERRLCQRCCHAAVRTLLLAVLCGLLYHRAVVAALHLELKALPWTQRMDRASGGDESFVAYVAEAYVGTPPQRKRLVVDTGSSALAMTPITGSSTLNVTTQRDSIRYDKGSWVGVVSEDVVQFGDTRLRARFTTITESADLFHDVGAHDGIWGLLYNPRRTSMHAFAQQDNDQSSPSPPQAQQQQQQHHEDTHNKASDKASNNSPTQQESTSSRTPDFALALCGAQGDLWLATEKAHHISRREWQRSGVDMHYMRLVADGIYLAARFSGVTILTPMGAHAHATGAQHSHAAADRASRYHSSSHRRASRHRVRSGGVETRPLEWDDNVDVFSANHATVAIFDTGTTFLLLPADLYKRVINGLRRHFDLHGLSIPSSVWNGYCASLDPTQWPPLAIHLKGYTITVSGHQYLNQQGRGIFCLGLGVSSSSHRVILGAAVLQGLVLHFDVEHNRVGIAHQKPVLPLSSPEYAAFDSAPIPSLLARHNTNNPVVNGPALTKAAGLPQHYPRQQQPKVGHPGHLTPQGRRHGRTQQHNAEGPVGHEHAKHHQSRQQQRMLERGFVTTSATATVTATATGLPGADNDALLPQPAEEMLRQLREHRSTPVPSWVQDPASTTAPTVLSTTPPGGSVPTTETRPSEHQSRNSSSSRSRNSSGSGGGNSNDDSIDGRGGSVIGRGRWHTCMSPSSDWRPQLPLGASVADVCALLREGGSHHADTDAVYGQLCVSSCSKCAAARRSWCQRPALEVWIGGRISVVAFGKHAEGADDIGLCWDLSLLRALGIGEADNVPLVFLPGHGWASLRLHCADTVLYHGQCSLPATLASPLCMLVTWLGLFLVLVVAYELLSAVHVWCVASPQTRNDHSGPMCVGLPLREQHTSDSGSADNSSRAVEADDDACKGAHASGRKALYDSEAVTFMCAV
ncbi:hypothetical protein PTSG_11738 [Salpingoeca rosetta]|uniref:Peptidase A1 domain-containing protein n=1 Tax=Salpingoeca rosetta (strain ATCC 50818 / BSB-021) TaxID=946362 RepID=F2U0F6_SALR5|nr:uncharacterized protein PTSG_11738 [Salpingoeca rosetta]EGD80884.1 hypothetical protein PTSG_11738 [Salpingoeca rosetta]|eukprot:XP_004997445.1 hypothetical protein PTSG_11738 [Salpingoeca rosetta]